MKLLFITQRIDETHPDLAFTTQWVDAFIDGGYDVDVVCLQKGKFDDRFPVYSLGKENGNSKIKSALLFLKYVLTHNYDRIFVHMNAEYYTIAGWWWFITKTPTYLWYTHYTTHIHLKIAAFVSKRMFAATKQSLPQYDNSKKKVVTGHGVDTSFWNSENSCLDSRKMITVHRLNRSKRAELTIGAMALLPEEYTLDIYGEAVDADYYKELNDLVAKLNLGNRVKFKGTVVKGELQQIYPKYRAMINMASETIDKTMIEGMCGGVYPVTTKGNAEAIGIPGAPKEDTSEAIANYIKEENWKNTSVADLKNIVREGHDLQMLIKKMNVYIKKGN